MKKIILVLTVISVFTMFASLAEAHPGRTDAYGGHTCRTNCAYWGYSTGEYHYHNTYVAPKSTTTPKPISKPTPTKKPTTVKKVTPTPTKKPPTNIVLKVGTFMIGSSAAQVKKVMGTPTSASEYSYRYGYSSVSFTNGIVTGYSTIDTPLKVFMGYKNSSAPAFTIGSTKAQVIAAMGTPTSANEYSYRYGYSSVSFTDGRVSSYNTIDVELKVR